MTPAAITLPPVSSLDAPAHARPASSSSGGAGHSSQQGTPVYLPPLTPRHSSASMHPPASVPAPRPDATLPAEHHVRPTVGQKRSLEQFQFPRPSDSPQRSHTHGEANVAVKREPSDSPPHRSLEPTPSQYDAQPDAHAQPGSQPQGGEQQQHHQPHQQSPHQGSSGEPPQEGNARNPTEGVTNSGRKRRRVSNLNTAKANGNPSPANASGGPPKAQTLSSRKGATGANKPRASPLPLHQSTHRRTASGNLLSVAPDQPSPVSPIVMGFDAASALQDPNRAPTVRKSLNLKEQQKALIEARKSGGQVPALPQQHQQQQQTQPQPARDTNGPASSASATLPRQNGRDPGNASRARTNTDLSGQGPNENAHGDHPSQAPTMAGRREKARKLTIQTSTGGPSEANAAVVADDDAEVRPEAQRAFSQSIKSAPIRPSGFQQTAQNARLPPPTAGFSAARQNGHPEGHLPHPHAHHLQVPYFRQPLTAGPRVGFPPDARMQAPPASRLSPIMSASDGPPTSLPPMRDAVPQSATGYGPSAQQWHQGAVGHARERASANKAAFLGLFDTFYDSLSDSQVLQSNLEDQIRRSAALLNSLQQSSGVFETMLDRRIGELCKSLTGDLQVIEGRIERLEKAFEGSQGSSLPPLTPALQGSLDQQQQQSGPRPPSPAAHEHQHRGSLADLSAIATATPRHQNDQPTAAAAASDSQNAQTNFADASANAKSRLQMLEQSATSLLDSRLSSHATSNLRSREEEQQRQAAQGSSGKPT